MTSQKDISINSEQKQQQCFNDNITTDPHRATMTPPETETTSTEHHTTQRATSSSTSSSSSTPRRKRSRTISLSNHSNLGAPSSSSTLGSCSSMLGLPSSSRLVSYLVSVLFLAGSALFVAAELSDTRRRPVVHGERVLVADEHVHHVQPVDVVCQTVQLLRGARRVGHAGNCYFCQYP